MGEGKHLYKKNALSFLVITCFGWVGINPFYGCFLLLSEGRLSGWCAWMTEGGWGGVKAIWAIPTKMGLLL